MAEDKVSAKILGDAKKHLAAIEAEFQEKEKKLEAAFDEQKKAYREETERLVRSEQERIRREALSEARLAARRELLGARHELITRVLQKAAEEFTSSRNYPALIAKIVALSPKRSKVLLSPDDIKRLKSFPWARKAEPASIKGGVILSNPGHDLNFSLDASFEMLAESLTLEIAHILFGDAATASKESKAAKKKNINVNREA